MFLTCFNAIIRILFSEGMDKMGRFYWQYQLEARRRRTRYERIGTFLLVVFILGFCLWRFFYADSPDYALEQLEQGIKNHDAKALQEYCDLEAISGQAYDDLMRDMFAQDDKLSTDTKVMFEQFYIKIKPQVVKDTAQLLLSYAEKGSWQNPADDSLLKGRQLGMDYEYLIERSQLRNTSLVKLENVDRRNDTAQAKVQVKDDYTGTIYTLNLTMNKTPDGWKVVKIANYRDYLDFITPIQTSGLLGYNRDTQDIIDKYNDILDTQQTHFNQLTDNVDGRLTKSQRSRLADYIKSDIIPALEKRQKELDAVAVRDGAQYLKALRAEETTAAIAQWQHFLTGIQDNNFAELNTANAFHQKSLNLQHRIDDVIKNTAITKMPQSIP